MKVNVDFVYDPGYPDEVGFSVRSPDGSALTAQQIMDAVSEALLFHFQGDPGAYPRSLDS